ncbi:molybdopterin-dependent oxidoreductase [Candidatus Omnitrophota bacterium]
MSSNQVIRSVCGFCLVGCGILVHVEDGKPVKIKGDPDCPLNKGEICGKCRASLEYLYHPDRLKHPLKRVGERGQGKWEQISWDEALNIIAAELIRAKQDYGAKSVAMVMGSAKGLQDALLKRFTVAFGTPNLFTSGHVCALPRILSSQITYGFSPYPDYEYPPACIITWGYNMAETRTGEYRQTVQALDRGTKLIVIDPRKIKLAERADLWLQVRPGSDLALALGMINVIVNEGLFDKYFVDNWTVGFDELKTRVEDYPPEKVAEITWVPAAKIREAARFYATNKPACIQMGNALEQNINSFQAGRAISILRAITGNLGIPGGELQWSPLPSVSYFSRELEMRDKMPMDEWQTRIDADLELLPLFDRSIPQIAVKAILEGDPYHIRTAYIQGSNPLLTWSNAQQVYKALNKLDFLAVSDMFMTPTSELADIVLPVATYLEYDYINVIALFATVQVRQKVAQIGECWSDIKIIFELAKRVGLGKYFWDDERQFLDYLLKPLGITFEEFRNIGIIPGTKQYRQYEVNGFTTPSHKVELYSSQLKDWGFDPVPEYYELPETPFSDPELAREYPLIFTTLKSAPFRHSGGRQISSLRGTHPEPIVHINTESANRLGIKEGDWVYIETKRGRIKQKAALTDSIDPRVVWADYGWWFPEKGTSELYGWAESNINILTDDRPPFGRELGTSNLRGILCKIYKV